MEKVKSSLNTLIEIMNELREKCPWDKKQTLESLREKTIEEVYELSEAIINNDKKNIEEELGDLLLHIVFYAKIGSEKKQFTLNSIINTLIIKLKKRHPHVYVKLIINSQGTSYAAGWFLPAESVGCATHLWGPSTAARLGAARESPPDNNNARKKQ